VRTAPKIQLPKHDHDRLVAWVAARGEDAPRARRAEIVLLAAAGQRNKAIAGLVQLSERSVGLVRRSYLERGLDGIRGRLWSRAPLPPRLVDDVVQLTALRPATGRRWSTRTMAEVMGLSPNTISRIWRASGIRPHAGERVARGVRSPR
jgi:transposase